MSASTPTTRPLSVLAAALFATALLTGCTPPAQPEPSASPTPSESTPSETPEPDPTRPPLADLVLTTEGLGTIVIGQAPDADPATSMVLFDPAACDGFGVWNTDPSYAIAADFGPAIAFGVGGAGVAERVEVYSDSIPTDAGIIRGVSTRADVEAAYPGAAVVPAPLTDVYVVPGTAGDLLVEVTANDAAYWESSGIALDTVQYLRAITHGAEPYSIAASGNVVGACGS